MGSVFFFLDFNEGFTSGQKQCVAATALTLAILNFHFLVKNPAYVW